MKDFDLLAKYISTELRKVYRKKFELKELKLILNGKQIDFYIYIK